jgi:hypothetical protein
LSCYYFFRAANVQQIICCFNSLKSVSYHDNSQMTSLFFFNFLNIFNCILNFQFTFWIEGRSSFIKNQYFWRFNQSSCNRNSLFLSTRQIIHRRGANISVYTIFQSFNKLSICLVQCDINIFISCCLICKFHVFLDCSENENWLL